MASGNITVLFRLDLGWREWMKYPIAALYWLRLRPLAEWIVCRRLRVVR